MLNYVWFVLLLTGFIAAIINGRMDQVTQAIVGSASEAVELSIGLLGVMCLWTGLMEIARKSGLIRIIARLLRPVMSFLFPGVPIQHASAGAIVMNLAANFLGLGNAATPLGLKAMNELQRLNPHKDTATDAMCMFLVLNTSVIQLIPATIIAIRSKLGSQEPSSIIGTIWLASACAMTAGIVSAKLFSALWRKRRYGR